MEPSELIWASCRSRGEMGGKGEAASEKGSAQLGLLERTNAGYLLLRWGLGNSRLLGLHVLWRKRSEYSFHWETSWDKATVCGR